MEAAHIGILLTLGFLVGLLGMFVGLLLLFPTRTRVKGKRYVKFSGLLAGLSFIGIIVAAGQFGSSPSGVQSDDQTGRVDRVLTVANEPAEDQSSTEQTPREEPIADEQRERAAEATREAVERARLAHWDIRHGTSPLDDSPIVQIFTTSTNVHQDRYGRRKPLRLAIICQEDKTRAYINFADQFMADIQGKGRVDYRVDEGPARHRNFRESNDNSALGLWNGATAIPWLRELFGGSVLYVRAMPFSESQVSGEFDIEGIETVIEPLREACNW